MIMAVEKFYSVKEACALLGNISRTGLFRLRKHKRHPLKFVRIGNRPVFAASHIEEFQQQLLNPKKT
jgi:predicted DNA-binding transcriptional regulator AlpA